MFLSAHTMPGDTRLTTRELLHTQQNFQQRGLPGTIRPQDGDELTWFDREFEAIEDNAVPKTQMSVNQLNRWGFSVFGHV